MSKHSYLTAALLFALAVAEFIGLWAAGSGPAIAQDATPASTFGDPPDGISLEPIDRGTIEEVLVISRLMRVTRVTLSPDATRVTYTVAPGVYAVEDGTIAFEVDRELPTAARLIRPASDGSLRRSPVVLPGTSLALETSDVLAVPGIPDLEPPYASISARNGSDEPVTYLDVEIFPTSNPHVVTDSGDQDIQGLDINLGLATAQESAPEGIVVSRLMLEPGESIPLHGDAPLLTVAQEGTLTLSVDDGEAPLQRAGTRWGDAPEVLAAGDSTDLTGNDAAFLVPGSTGAMTNSGPDPITALVVTILAAELP